MASISMSFKKINKPINNNLRTSSNTRNTNVDNALRSNKGTGYDRQTMKYDNKRAVNVVGARENVEQADWRDDTDDEPEDQEFEAHYMYMAKIQEVTLDVADNSRPIFDTEPLQKVHNNDDDYNVFANERQHPEQPDLISEMENELSANKRTISTISFQKEEQEKFIKTHEDKDFKKVSSLENQVKVLNDIVYKTRKSVQTMIMLNWNCKKSFVKPQYLKKAQSANPRLYDKGFYNDNLSLMLAPESDETIHLAQESQS
ncbi:hypothetical protein Tco_0734662 [Tanacetum coccineum]